MSSLIFAALVLAMVPGTAAAQESNRAAVVIRMDDDRIVSQCVSFEEDQISGYEALRRSGLPVVAGFDAQGGTICQIDGLGCPADDCFCQCKGGSECVYWSYWHQNAGSWEYANIGSTARMVNHGQVDGWSWGPGSLTEAVEPPPTSFEQVCRSTNESQAAISTSAAATETSAENRVINARWPQILLFGGVLALVLLALVFSQVRKGRQ